MSLETLQWIAAVVAILFYAFYYIAWYLSYDGTIKNENQRYTERQKQENQEEQKREMERRNYKEEREKRKGECQERREKERRNYKARQIQEEWIHEDSRDEKSREDHQIREWHQFAREICTDYEKLNSQGILRKISKVKNTFERRLIHSRVTGLDVLRYMLTHCNFASESSQLSALRVDLHMIFRPLSIFSSMRRYGEVPANLKEGLRLFVEHLGTVAEPFLTGEQQRITLECLECFGCNTSSNAVTGRTKRVLNVEEVVPYVNSLRFVPGVDKAIKDCDYSECETFSLNLKETMIRENSEKNLNFLRKLNDGLQFDTQSVRTFSEYRAKLPFESLEQISNSDNNEVILMKVLHEVRLYIHFILSKSMHVSDNKLVQNNVTRLHDLCENKGSIIPLKDAIEASSNRVGGKLQAIAVNVPERLIRLNVLTKLKKFEEELFDEQLQDAFVN